jgi:hypothetical protein
VLSKNAIFRLFFAIFGENIFKNHRIGSSFDTSIETSSFLSGADALDMMSETTNATTPISLAETQNESRTPSLPDDGEFPCSQVKVVDVFGIFGRFSMKFLQQ